MAVILVLAVAAVLVPATLVPLLAARTGPALRRSAMLARGRDAALALTERFGRAPAAAITLSASTAAVVAVCWPLGEALSRLEGAVDRPVFGWVQDRQAPFWARANGWLTVMGDRPQIMGVCVLAAAVFAVFWRRRWWVPVVAMAGQFALEQVTQEVLKRGVDRGHPPTALGTFPSGGCARVIMTFGTIALLTVLTWRLPTGARVALFTGVATAASVEGYTRVSAQQHWLTDVFGGAIFGALLFGGFAVSLWLLAGPRPAPRAPHPGTANLGTASGSRTARPVERPT